VIETVVIQSGGATIRARLETELAPRTCDFFLSLLPLEGRFLHARWSGEAIWLPLGDEKLDLPHENVTSFPGPGRAIIYPGGLIEPELLFAYGTSHFTSIVGPLPGNHFLTLLDGHEDLAAIGSRTLRESPQDVSITIKT
jgi:hypothetical protein